MRPFLKWAGGKRWLADREELPSLAKFDRYIEPFLGSGAIYFHSMPKSAVLSDVNEELVELYNVMKDSHCELYERMCVHHASHNKEYYYRIRSERPLDRIDRASRFLYLNRTCFNGLYRVNLKGEFNVPIGTKASVIFPGEDFITYASALSSAEIIVQDFEVTLDGCGFGDVAFIDPPYTVMHNANGFIKYNENLFKWSDQVRLRDSVERATKRGCAIIMTNADHQSVRDLYKDILEYSSVSRRSVLSGSPNARGTTTEAMLTFGVDWSAAEPKAVDEPATASEIEGDDLLRGTAYSGSREFPAAMP
ncbi:DNA adenine methylase [Caulobacter sp. NIBR2454]|uniref:DNA adenine methylase n=1 Tax=Caulobacter sp. NIBR2454 TaxID=3015996 RepID=UPI0022B68A8B|nr:Dam family site-specific DNA-(adenine-N6)-methyltransferase [Caulobacter sp. NIBR2454]